MTDNEDRLRDALRAGSGHRQADDSDWAAFQDRLARSGGSRRGGARRWRVPVIAAAAVAAIAVATSAVITHGFGIGGQQATSGHGGSASQARNGVAVPIDAAASGAGDAVGQPVTSGAASGTSSPHRPNGTTPPSSGAASQTSAGSVIMAFVGGDPPKAALHGTFTFPSGPTTSGGSHQSDGTPLGYLSLSGGFGQNAGKDAHYLWGAVGPEVVQVQINAAGPSKGDSVFTGATGHWTIDSGQGTTWSSPDAASTVWTNIGHGWHGFAVQLPPGSPLASVVALGADAQLLQFRSVTVATGRFVDQQAAATTGMPPSREALTPLSPGGSEYAPPPASSQATARLSETAGRAPSRAGTGCPISGGSGTGSSDTGFNAGGIEFSADPPNPVVCFFDGVSTWNLARADNPMVAAITGVGTFVSMAQGAKPTKGRIVWGVVGSTVSSVQVVAGSSDPQSVGIQRVAAGVRAFYTRVPVAGRVTVTVKDADGTVVATTHLG